MSITATEFPTVARPPQKTGELDVDWEKIITEDDEPVDNLLTLRHMELWNACMADWDPGRQFIAASNNGLFRDPYVPPIVPDFYLSMDVGPPVDLELRPKDKSNRSYFVWIYGKPPDLVLELVSDKRGEELGRRKSECATMGVPYYVIYDPAHYIQSDALVCYEFIDGQYQQMTNARFPLLKLQLVEWEGVFHGHHNVWLRFADLDGELLPLGAERAELERQRANEQTKRANEQSKRADEQTQRAEVLAAKLRELGVDPGEL